MYRSYRKRGCDLLPARQIDISFEDDLNLYGSIVQLAKVSKCPIVLTIEGVATCSRFKALQPHVAFMERLDPRTVARCRLLLVASR